MGWNDATVGVLWPLQLSGWAPACARHGDPLAARRRVPAAVLPPATCAYAGNVRRFGPPHIRVVHYSIQGSFRVAKTNAARLSKGTHHEPNVAVSSDCVGVWCIGSSRVGPGCRYRPGRASRPISMVPRPTLAGDRRELGHECLPHLVPGRLRVPGKCWFIRL